MKNFLATLAAVVFSGAIAFASSIPTFTGSSEPSQIYGYLNQLIGSIQSGVNGLVANGSGAVNSTATTAEQTLVTTTIPANTLSKGGQSLRLRCAGGTAATTTNKLVKLYYGTSSVATPTMSTSAQTYDLELIVTYNVSAQSANYAGKGQVSGAQQVVPPVSAVNATDDMSTALTAKCTTTQGTASANDTVNQLFLVEQIK